MHFLLLDSLRLAPSDSTEEGDADLGAVVTAVEERRADSSSVQRDSSTAFNFNAAVFSDRSRNKRARSA